MSKDTQKTYDSQTGHFLAIISQNMPSLEASEMQYWVERPRKLRQILALAMRCNPNDNFWTPTGQGKGPVREVDGVPLPVTTMRCGGENPLDIATSAPRQRTASLKFGVEYAPIGEDGQELVLRPYIDFEYIGLVLPAVDTYRGGKKLNITLGSILPLLERKDGSLPEQIVAAEEHYVDTVVAFIRDDLETKLICNEVVGGWSLVLRLLTDNVVYYATSFNIKRADFEEHLKSLDLIEEVD